MHCAALRFHNQSLVERAHLNSCFAGINPPIPVFMLGGLEIAIVRLVHKKALIVPGIAEVTADRTAWVALSRRLDDLIFHRLNLESNQLGFRRVKHSVNPGTGSRRQPAAAGARGTITFVELQKEDVDLQA